MAKPVTREEKENSKREFDKLNHLINNELKGLEGWLLKSAQPKLTNLQKLLRGDMTDQDTRWECEAEIWIAKTLTKQGQSKIDYIDNLVTNHPAKLFSHLVAIYIVCYEMGASAHYFNTYQYLHIWTVVGNAWSYLYRTDFFVKYTSLKFISFKMFIFLLKKSNTIKL